MRNTIITYSELENRINLDREDHILKDIAILFLQAMDDWPMTITGASISQFTRELKGYFGNPLTIASIQAKRFDVKNAWQIESGSSIVALIDKSTRFGNQSDFDEIVASFLQYYRQANLT